MHICTDLLKSLQQGFRGEGWGRNIHLKSKSGSYYNLRHITQLRDSGRSKRTLSSRSVAVSPAKKGLWQWVSGLQQASRLEAKLPNPQNPKPYTPEPSEHHTYNAFKLQTTWVVVKIRVLFWLPKIIRQCLGYPKGTFVLRTTHMETHPKTCKFNILSLHPPP